MTAPIIRLPRVEPMSPLDPRAIAIIAHQGVHRIPVRCESCRALLSVSGDLSAALAVGCPLCRGTVRRDP